MGSTRAKSRKGGIVSAHRIPLVIGKTVTGMTRVERSHQRIARNLSQN